MRYGLRSVTMDDIAKELSVSKKTIYQEFKDKTELILLITKRQMDFYLSLFDQVEDKGKNALHELYLFSRVLRKNLEEMSPNLLYDMQKYHLEAWELFKNYKDEHFHSQLVRVLKKGVEEGVFRPEIKPEILAILRMKEAELCFDHTVYPNTKFDYKEVQIEVLDHFVMGLLTDQGRELWNQYNNNTDSTL